MGLVNLHFLQNALRHYLYATPVDILHSPFVFSLYNNCIKNAPCDQVCKEIEQLRKDLLSDHSSLYFDDHGASARSRDTTVSHLARRHLKPARLAQILYRTALNLKPQTALELGTSLGVTTAYLSKGAGTVHTIEGGKEVHGVATSCFNKLGITNIHAHCGTFDEVLPQLLPALSQLDLVYIDGNHSYEATIRYFEMIRPLLHNNSVVIFDDLYWSPGMTRAWQEIQADPDVQVTVDLFFIGMVFFRKEQAKQNFRLRVF